MSAKMQTVTLMLDAKKEKEKAEEKDYLLDPVTLKRRADAGDPSAQFLVAYGHAGGRFNFPINYQEAEKYLELAKQTTELHGGVGRTVEGYIKEMTGDLENALPYYSQDYNYIPGRYLTYAGGYKMTKAEEEKSGTPNIKTRSEIIKGLLECAELGYVPAISFLGERYLEGWGVEFDPKKGFELLHEAANKGHGSARIFLAQTYESGFSEWNISVNKAESQKWYRLAAEQNFPEAEKKLKSKNGGGCTIV